MSTKKTSARTAVTRVLIFSLALGLIAAITASAAPSGSLAFLDSVKEFLGIQRTEVSVLKEQPKTLAQANEPTIAPLMGPMALPYVWNAATLTPTSGSDPNITTVAFDTPAANNNGTTTMITTTSASSGYAGASGTSNFGAAVKAGTLSTATSTYFAITLTPASTYSINLTSMSLGSRSTSTGPQTITIYSSIDSYATAIGSASVSNGGVWALSSISFSGSSLSGTASTPVTLRIYGSGVVGSPSANTATWRIDDITLSVTATAPVSPPTSLAYSSNPATYTNGVAITNNTPTSGGGAVDSYGITPALPAGLAFSTSTGIISGTPSVASAATDYTVTATNGGGSTNATVNITVNKGNQTTLTINDPGTVTYGSTPTLTTSGGSGTGAVTFSHGISTGCTVTSGGLLTVTNASGTCDVTASRAADSNYNVSNTASRTITLAKAGQSTLAISNPGTVTYGSTPQLTTTGGAGTGALTFAHTGSTGCTITSGGVLTVTNASGTCDVTASKAADNNYNASNTASRTITLAKATQATLSINDPGTVTYGATPQLTTTGGSGTGALTFAHTGSTGCTVTSGGILTVTDASGTCDVTASKAADNNYNVSNTGSRTITLAKANQATLSINDPGTVTYGSTPQLTTTGGNGTGALTFSHTGSTGCTVTSGGVLTVTNASGTCDVTASKAADNNYNVSNTASRTITLAKANQATLTVNDPGTVTYGSTPTLTTSGGSGGGAVTFSQGSSTGCTVTSGGVLTVTNAGGTCDVTASKAADSNYDAASSAARTITLAKAAAVITFGTAPTPTFPGADFTVNATTTNTDSSALTYSYVSGPCSHISGATFRQTGAGTCVVQADGAATTNFNAAAPVQQSVTISQVTYLLTVTSGANGSVTSSPAGINCGIDCTETYNADTVVTLSAEPDAGYKLSSWTGACSGSGACVVTMDAAKTVGATFVQNDQTFNTPGAHTLPAGTYHDITIDDPGAVVTGTGDIVITGTFRVRRGAWGTSGSPNGYAILSGGPGSAFILESGGTLRVTSPAGITASGATGAIQTATRTYDTGASYVYDGSTSQAVGDGLPTTVGNLTIGNTGPDAPSADNKVTGNNGQIVTGLLNIVDGVYESHSDYTDVTIAAAGTLTLTGNTTVSGNWTNAGTLVHNNFTVTLDGGTGQTISGTTTFYGLTKAITTPAQTLNFTAGSTTNVAGPLTLTGTSGNVLSLRSGTPATQWNINATGSRNVDYVDVQDSNATGSGSAINATNSSDAGNNTNWTFNTLFNYLIDVTQTANGTISPDDTTVTAGANQTFYITPAMGYDIVSITVDSGPVPVAGSYTFTNVTTTHTITATYAPQACRTISIAASTSNTGVPVTIPVNTTDVTGGNVISADFKVTYDPAVITPAAGGPSAVVTAGTVLPGGTLITANVGTPGTIEVSLSGTTPFTGTGTLVDLHFDVVGAPTTSTALTLSPVTGPGIYYNGGTVCANVSSGSLSVVSTASATVVTTSPLTTSVYGDNVTFTATITPATTGGTVQFQIDGNNAGAPVAVVSGVATYSTTTLQVTGSAHNITGNYSGFSPYSASSGSTSITITARPITVTATADSRGYDGSTSSSATPTITSGTLANSDAGVFTQTFDNRNVGTVKTLTPSGTVTDGNSGNNYAITFVPVTTGTITARAITVTAATDSKGYDGTTSSAGIPTVTSGSIVSPDAGSFSQTFATKHVGTGKTINAAGSVNDLNGGANYAITFVANTTGVILARAITVTATADTKGYDGNTSSAALPTITSGSLGTGDSAAFSQVFDTRDAGSGKTLTPSGTITDGNGGNNYAVTYTPVSTGVITARAITVTAATDTRVYDGTTGSTGTPAITSGSLISPDSATLSQTFDTKNVGTGKTLTALAVINDGNSGANYAVTYVADTTGVITARAITVTASTDSREYNGTTSSSATPVISPGTIAAGDTAGFTQSFATKHVGTGKTLTASGSVSDGFGGANYAVTFIANTTGVITAKAITVTASTDSREYNGTTSSSASPNISPALVGGDTSGFTQSFDNRNVGAGKTLTAAGAAIDGNSGANYAVTFVTNTTGVITARAITVTAVTETRGYDGTTASSGSPTISPALVGGDTSGFTQSFDNKNVGTGKTLTAAGTVNDGFGGANYAVTFVSVSTGVITARAITVTAATDSRVYNGTTNSAGTPTITTGSLAVGDSAVFSQTFDTKHVGIGKTLTPAGTITDGNLGNNYAATYTAVSTGTITARPITVTAVTETKVYDGTTSSSVSPNISPALVGGDTSGFTQTFDTKNAGAGKTLTAAGAAIDGNSGNNYAVTFAAVSTGVITARAITVTAVTDTRGYDGTTASSGSPTIVPALVGGDTSGFTQTFDTKHAGTGKTLTATGAAIDGNSGNNYAVTFVTNTTGVITARAITVTAATDTKIYDGTTASAGVPAITSGSLAVGDSAVFSQTFDTRHVGTGKTLTPAGTITDGNSGNNYAVTYATNSTGVITTRAATWTTDPASKTFGDADPVPLTTGSGSGFLVVDGVSATYSRVAGEAASGPTYHITATLTAATGDLADYSITNTGAEFTINARTLTGTVTYENAAPGTVPIKQTTLTSTGSAPLPAPVQTDLNGNYSLTGFGTTSYTITPTRAPYATNQFNGIFANDASLIAQHVVHLITLNAAQQKAADVSGIGAITSFDASLVAQYIVGIPNGLNKTGSWTFTPASASLIVTPGSVRDFTGILMGDVSGDWNPAGARPAQLIGKDAVSSVRAVVPNVTAAPGTAISVPFRIENLEGAGVKAYQFDIEYNPAVVAPASIAATVNGTLSEGLSVVSNAPAPGLLKVVVFGAFPVSGDGVYVNLQFLAIGGPGASSPLSIREFRLDDGQTPVFTIDGSLTLASATNENSIRGRLLTPFGAGVSNATVILTGTTINTRVHVISGGMGYFEFGGLVTGETYTVSVRSKRFTFSPRTVSVTQNVTNLDMIAEQ